MSLKIYYDEMTAEMIFLEIIKKLMNIDYSDDFFGLEDIFLKLSGIYSIRWKERWQKGG